MWAKSPKVPGTTFTILPYMCGSFSFVVHPLTIFDPLIWRGFWIFLKFKVGNWQNPYHDVRVICFSIPNFLLKFEYCNNQKSSLGKTKSILHNFLRALFWWNVKMIGDTSFEHNQRWKVILSFVAELGFPRSDCQWHHFEILQHIVFWSFKWNFSYFSNTHFHVEHKLTDQFIRIRFGQRSFTEVTQ